TAGAASAARRDGVGSGPHWLGIGGVRERRIDVKTLRLASQVQLDGYGLVLHQRADTAALIEHGAERLLDMRAIVRRAAGDGNGGYRRCFSGTGGAGQCQASQQTAARENAMVHVSLLLAHCTPESDGGRFSRVSV